MRDATLHEIKLNGYSCVTFREVEYGTETLSFHCYPMEREAIREMSIFKYKEAWEELAKQ